MLDDLLLYIVNLLFKLGTLFDKKETNIFTKKSLEKADNKFCDEEIVLEYKIDKNDPDYIPSAEELEEWLKV